MAGGLESFERFARTFNAGEIIFSEFEPGDNFYVIQAGRVHLVKIIGDFEKTLDIIGPPDMFGEMAILENSPRSATAIALDNVKVLEFNARNFEVLLLGNPQIALRLLRMFCKRIYDAKRRFMTLVLSEPQAKIADVFLMFDETQPNIDKTTEKREFEATVDNIAQWAGMDAKETRDILQHFASQHRLEIHADRIVVKNINDFSRFVNSRRNKL
ncbi:MAG: cyclic nucleotide-binding domain-containing protein [Treponema sp.]|jgi:CRP-like cAMP-binding protein|nr:cyclic nucleotide-binding domain-containing protein [Treponema sp.]